LTCLVTFAVGMCRLATVHSVTDRQTDRWQYDASSRSSADPTAVRLAKTIR